MKNDGILKKILIYIKKVWVELTKQSVSFVAGIIITVIVLTKTEIINFITLPIKTRDRVVHVEQKQDSIIKVINTRVSDSDFQSHKDLNIEQFKSIDSKLQLMINLMYELKNIRVNYENSNDTTSINSYVNVESIRDSHIN